MPNKADIIKNEEKIQPYQLQQSILLLRGEQVLLDFQLAKLYGVETRVLKQAVNRNIERFPEDFMFKLTKDEANSLISNGGSQIVMPNNKHKSHYVPQICITKKGRFCEPDYAYAMRDIYNKE